MPQIGTFLLVPDEVQKADCIVALRGEEYFRLGKAAELQKQGLAPVIVLSVIPRKTQPYDMVRVMSGYIQYDETEIAFRILEYFGVKRSAILFTGKEATSTYQEALAARELILQKGYKSMLLVTSTYHMRRSLFLFQHAFKDTGVAIHPVTSQHELYRPELWWTQERDMRRVAEEYTSFLFNLAFYFVFNKTATSFDSA